MSDTETVRNWLLLLDQTEEHINKHLSDMRFIVSWIKENSWNWSNPTGSNKREWDTFPHGTLLGARSDTKVGAEYTKRFEPATGDNSFEAYETSDQWIYLSRVPNVTIFRDTNSTERCKNFTMDLTNMKLCDPNLNSRGKEIYPCPIVEEHFMVRWTTWYFLKGSDRDIFGDEYDPEYVKRKLAPGEALDTLLKQFPDTPEQVPCGVLERFGPIHLLSSWVDVIFSLALQKVFIPIQIGHNNVVPEVDREGRDCCGKDGPDYRDINDAEIHFSPDSLAEATHHAFEVLRTWAKWGPVSTAGAEVEAETPDNIGSAKKGDGGKGDTTPPGGARLRIIATLTKHHKYAINSCLNYEAIGVNALAKEAGVAAGSVTHFFNKFFDGHNKYKIACREQKTLIIKLKILNADFTQWKTLNDASVESKSDDD